MSWQLVLIMGVALAGVGSALLYRALRRQRIGMLIAALGTMAVSALVFAWLWIAFQLAAAL